MKKHIYSFNDFLIKENSTPEYDEYVNELFGFKTSINWQHLPDESAINIIHGNDIWKIKDPLFSNLNDADNIFIKVVKHIKNLSDKSKESISELLNKLFLNSEITYLSPDTDQPT